MGIAPGAAAACVGPRARRGVDRDGGRRGSPRDAQRERARVRVGLEQPVVERRQVGQEHVGLRQVAKRAQAQHAVRVGRDRRAGLAGFRGVLPETELT